VDAEAAPEGEQGDDDLGEELVDCPDAARIVDDPHGAHGEATAEKADEPPPLPAHHRGDRGVQAHQEQERGEEGNGDRDPAEPGDRSLVDVPAPRVGHGAKPEGKASHERCEQDYN
jgi:hypothetical protein